MVMDMSFANQALSVEFLRRKHKSLKKDVYKVPDAIDMQRAREILEELRRRSGEATRPPVELDYLERLLKRF